MAAYTDLWGKDAVLKQFDEMAVSLFEVTCAKEKKFDSIDFPDDIDGAKKYLEQQLNAIEYFGNPSMFKILFYRQLSPNGKLTIDNLKATNTFKIMEEQSNASYWQEKNKNDVGRYTGGGDQDLREQVKVLNDKLEALLQEPDEVEEKKAPEGIAGMLGSILNNPQVQEALVTRILGFVDQVLPAKGNQYTMKPAPAIGEISGNEIDVINQSLEVLFANGLLPSDLKLFAEVSTNDKATFNMYLMMLRKPK